MKKKITVVAVVIILLVSLMALAACATFEPYPDEYFTQMRMEDASRAADTNIRVMSANVLVHITSWGGVPVPPRAQMFAETVKHYVPDVVALQEYCECWYKELPKQIEDYTMLRTKKSDYTTMMYNNKTMRLVAEGKINYSKHANKNCRFVIYGVFERIADNKRVIVTSTHWDFGIDEDKQEMRSLQAAEHATLMDELMQKYNAPIISGGDYNAMEQNIENGAQFYKEFVAKSNAINSKFVDGVIRRSLPEVDYDEEAIDHIFIKGNVKPLLFNILYNEYYEKMSDHAPIYLDAMI